MSAFGFQYVIDNNTLKQLSRPQRASKFFRQNVRIPSEVLHEARGFGDLADLRRNEYRTTPAVLLQLVRVMATVKTTDTRLVDLYANHGNADPLVVACALDGQDREGGLLLSNEWAVVTDDHAVRAKAEEFDLRVLSNAQFAALIDAAGSDGARGEGHG
jgi:hypothetical protein